MSFSQQYLAETCQIIQRLDTCVIAGSKIEFFSNLLD
jgi:hypothetical protein